MIISEYISAEYFPLKPTDTVQFALLMMEDYNVVNFPVVANNTVVGYVRNQDLVDLNPDLPLTEVAYAKIYLININHSILKALRLFSDSGYDLLAIEDDMHFKGILSMRSLVRSLGDSLSTQHDGAVIAINCYMQDYSLSLISRMVETEGGMILSVWTQFDADSNKLDILLKLNYSSIDHLVNLLQQKGYKIQHTISKAKDDYLEDRYNALMKYLDI